MKTVTYLGAILVACQATSGSAADLPSDRGQFQALVEREIVIGSSIESAKDRLKAVGLECKSVARGWTNNVHDTTEFIFCSRNSDEWPVFRRWQVALLPRDGKVAEIRSNVGLIGP